jgi:hypothetical protein
LIDEGARCGFIKIKLSGCFLAALDELKAF